ncbi:FG-GAP-like repeat-containing protein [Luteolibacter sp. LG18]|uniref:FG-GAP-like repeat-containing protein n=1 Tax=Luteolibacter sp. LG18 TaxID=2819286 RepID=UPI002B31111E|nr:hypothetical protein llg_30790 [Luteolibacter sp. LG18]
MLDRTALVVAALTLPAAAVTAPWNSLSGSAVRPFWDYATFAGTPLFTLDTSAGRSTVVQSGSSWYTIAWDASTSSFQQTHVAPPVAASKSITKILAAQMSGDATPEIVVIYQDGDVLIYDAVSYELVKSFDTSSSLVRAATAADLDGDGFAEIMVGTLSALYVHDRNGAFLWSVPATGSFTAVEVGQLDSDPAKEIVLGNGKVIDSATRTVQWTRPAEWPSWGLLALRDVNGDGRDEIYASAGTTGGAGFSIVDVQENKLVLNQPRTSQINNLVVADIDSTPGYELLISDARGVTGYTLDGNTATFSFGLDMSDFGGGAGISAGTDLNGDGVKDLLLSPYDTTADIPFLFVRSDTLASQYLANVRLAGPYLTPVTGDITGDGVPELVGASADRSTNRVLVFDTQTLGVLGISDNLYPGGTVSGLSDLKLRDVDGDGTKEILIAGDNDGSADVTVLRYQPATHTFATVWSNPDKPEGSRFTKVEILDLNGDGKLEIIAANIGGDGCHLNVIDYATGALQWRSPVLGTDTRGFTCMEIGDIDGDGNLEAVLSGSGNGIVVVDLIGHAVEYSTAGGFTAVTLRTDGFTAGKIDGSVLRYTATGAGTYTLDSTVAMSDQKVSGLMAGPGQGLWISSGSRMQYWPDSSAPVWSTEIRLTESDGAPAFLWTLGGYELFGGYDYGFSAFETAPAELGVLPSVSLGVGGTSVSEGSAAAASFAVYRTGPTSSPLDVHFTLAGSASSGDVAITGATDAGDGTWVATIPAGSASTAGTIAAIDDTEAEGPEQLVVALASGSGYKVDLPGVSTLGVVDNETALSISLLNGLSQCPETATAGAYGFVITRSGDLSKSLRVNLVASGSATAAKDYRKLATTATIAAGQASVTVPFVPMADKIVEGTETVILTVAPGTGYGAISGRSAATINLLDVSSVVSLAAHAPSVSGIDVPVVRSGGIEQPLTLTIVEEKVPVSGRPSSSRKRITFPAHSSSAIYHVKPGKIAFGDTVSLLPDASFVIGGAASATFTVHP